MGNYYMNDLDFDDIPTSDEDAEEKDEYTEEDYADWQCKARRELEAEEKGEI